MHAPFEPQTPLMHARPCGQGRFGSHCDDCTHWPPTQKAPSGHWLSFMQPVGFGTQTARAASQVVPGGQVTPFAPQPVEMHAPFTHCAFWPQSIEVTQPGGGRHSAVAGSQTRPCGHGTFAQPPTHWPFTHARPGGHCTVVPGQGAMSQFGPAGPTKLPSGHCRTTGGHATPPHGANEQFGPVRVTVLPSGHTIASAGHAIGTGPHDGGGCVTHTPFAPQTRPCGQGRCRSHCATHAPFTQRLPLGQTVFMPHCGGGVAQRPVVASQR